mgnify:CR=1 FL=1
MSRTTVIHRSLLVCLCLVALLGAVSARAQPPPPDDPLNQVGFDQRLNEQVPLDLVFRDETGELVRLGGYFATKPVILTLNYYECPNLCTLVLTQLVETMRKLPFDVEADFTPVATLVDVSNVLTINPAVIDVRTVQEFVAALLAGSSDITRANAWMMFVGIGGSTGIGTGAGGGGVDDGSVLAGDWAGGDAASTWPAAGADLGGRGAMMRVS